MTKIETRKQRHIRVSLDKKVEAEITTGFEDVNLVHKAVPEIDLNEVDTSTVLFGKKLSAPLIISAITGGTEKAKQINETLASVAEKVGIGIGVGSQRIAIQQPETIHTFSIVREKAPTTFVMGNIGCPQLSLGLEVEQAQTCIDVIQADALAIHMNATQEAVQVKGDTNYRNILSKVKELSSALQTPIVMKETGCGISFEDANKLEKAGASGFEISGLGGTSWAAVEYHIAKEVKDPMQEYLGKALWNWGIPTASSLYEVRKASQLPIIASGGLRSGQDVAKCIAMGANVAGIAKPFLEKAVEGEKPLEEYVNKIIQEFKVIMFLAGTKNVEELSKAPYVITGWTSEWLNARGFDTRENGVRGR
jgi:isopentenyl-diphosphate delta-isomerase